jgi:hypothetical protein
VRRRALLVAGVAGLAACASAPPTPRRALAAADLFALDPPVLRAAVLVDARVLVQAVTIELRPLAGDDRYVVRLQQPVAPDSRLPAAPAGRAWQSFALGADGTATLVGVRDLLKARATAVTVAVAALPAMVPADLVAALPLRIDLLVDNGEGWFTQADATLDLRR